MSSPYSVQEAFETLDSKQLVTDLKSPIPDLQPQELSHSLAKLWRKLDLLVLPLVCTIYFFFSLDRYTIGNARVAGMQSALHMTNHQYSIVLTAQLVPQIFVQIPANYLMITFGPRIVMPSMLLCGGIVSVFQGFISNFGGLLTCRFLLGFFQGGLLPGLHLYLATFYPPRKLQVRIAILHAALAAASAFSGLLCAAIIHMDGVAHKPGWAWLFILVGIVVVIVALMGYFLLPDSPSVALFLRESERTLITDVLRDDGIIVEGAEKGHFWVEFGRIFTQPHILLLVVVDMFYDSSSTGLSTFLPSIVASMGYKGSIAQLMSVPPFAASAAMAILTGYIADRYAARGSTTITMGTMATIGFTMFLVSSESRVRYGSLFLLVPGVFCIGPSVSAWIANNTAPLVRRGTALGLAATVRNLGSILSYWLYGSISPAPRYTSATITLLSFQVGTVVCIAGTWVYIIMENKRKAGARVEWRRRHGSMMEPPRELPLRNESIWYNYVT